MFTQICRDYSVRSSTVSTKSKLGQKPTLQKLVSVSMAQSDQHYMYSHLPNNYTLFLHVDKNVHAVHSAAFCQVDCSGDPSFTN